MAVLSGLVGVFAASVAATGNLDLEFSCPLQPETTRLESTFGLRRDPYTRRAGFHPGFDLTGPFADRVLAAADGVVVHAAPEGAQGRLVVLDHGNGWTTRYAHLHRIAVAEGDRITAGTEIGRLGLSGLTTRPLLHFEILKDKKSLNALKPLVDVCALDPPEWVWDRPSSVVLRDGGRTPVTDLPLSPQ